ncbi:GTP cyclohydrolase 1 type 2/Nif3 [Neocallimastix lanati (nom. inval.)]|uniref:ATP phosphoribosyltransferase n=1 Tax=Neocallimastix californiae TaxID=1754190 RepID=A0A1Y2EMM6_9FUNG|nr:GTP cyclohydrolase 1 type 2/Nif3 [Neocallimastix sp. JGI-2020a]ORY37323.1 hypothetical protein LY90DRAFT_511254 [Neocallimastix californiae]KAG4093135.1 GTP cyclohydrolase 1 type 2/Nif3 [Neocallimastix sp. JGI-2020a]KAG4093137.1 GTP cyclohydrolase 1 type 2/Nif3 [Neocallimastix sp. JGI-2020a]KAG4093138.1 GTP cyclohydrolase 1 type 2/Nif3 [Neocallimastix sp. JGI-2020a]|eukprot:ORY37323.1 hypothetical protein LY90DRAFT_511254 [Neocallimastix californiae]
MTSEFVKIEICIPEQNLDEVHKALIEVDAGHIGNYDACITYHLLNGTWRPLVGSNPYSGTTDEINRVKELQVEFICKAENLEKTVKAIRKVHPYETPIINAFPLLNVNF